MAEPHLTEEEIACARKLAELFESGSAAVSCVNWKTGLLQDPLGLPPARREPTLGVMESLDFIGDVEHHVEVRFAGFNIRANVVHYVRGLDRKPTMDLVDQFKMTLRQKPVTAGIIIVFLGLFMIVTFLNQLIGLLKVLAWFR
jgi:hypothetical protein